jgi:hypothetical protein
MVNRAASNMKPIWPTALGTRVEASPRSLPRRRHSIMLRSRKASRRIECVCEDASRNLRGFSQTSLRAYSSPISDHRRDRHRRRGLQSLPRTTESSTTIFAPRMNDPGGVWASTLQDAYTGLITHARLQVPSWNLYLLPGALLARRCGGSGFPRRAPRRPCARSGTLPSPAASAHPPA